MVAMSRSQRKWAIVAGLAGLLIVVAALNFQSIMFAIAFATAKGRPALLSDAGWGKPTSARKFATRFAPGVAESDLLEWLNANRFAIDHAKSSADRRISSLPCNEDVRVTWAADATGRLKTASAEVSEAGCL
jgi:hypothetical protein